MPGESGPISYLPSEGMSYDPIDNNYWDADLLNKEITRIFEVCHGCRLCFKYCESFPLLFKLIDQNYDGNVRLITDDDTRDIMNYCFQCKLCEVQCPYTRFEEHEFQLDFPNLVHRFKANQTSDRGVSFRDRLLGDPDKLGKYARLSFGTANLGNKIPPFRWMLEKILGIHRNKLLPPFSFSTFEKWAKKNGYLTEAKSEVILFQTCYVQHNEPEIGKDTLEVFEKNGVKIKCAKGLNCCGMPAWENGDLTKVRKLAKNNLDILIPHVDKGAKIVVINPTCSMMMRKEYPHLLEGADRARAEKLATAINDVSEYIWSIRKEDRFNTEFQSSPEGNVSYHIPCHLRVQRIGFPARGLMKKVSSVTVSTIIECSGHDGTYALKKDSFESSKKIGKKSFDGMDVENAKIMVSDCPLAAKQFEQNLNKKVLHPMSFLAKAYREDGFER